MNSGQKSILVVDDEELNLDMLSRRLTRTGFKVQVAKSGGEALALISRCEFALVLLDHMMPEMSGRKVLSELRKSYSPAALPVIMFTAVAESDKIAEALEAGANDYVTKPIDYKVALARIQVQLAQRDAEMALRTSEQRYALAAEASRDALWDWDLVENSIFFLHGGWRCWLCRQCPSKPTRIYGFQGYLDRISKGWISAYARRAQDYARR